MTLREKISAQIRQTEKKQLEEDTAHRGLLRNRSYHKYFEGYTEYLVQKSAHKKKIVRVYTAPYYRKELSSGKGTAFRIAYLLLLLAAVCFFAIGAAADLSYNSRWYVVIPEALSIMLLFYLMILVLQNLVSPELMDLHHYDLCHTRMMTIGRAAALPLIITFFCMLIGMMAGGGISVQGLLYSGCMLPAGLCVYAIYKIEESITCVTVPNRTERPEGGIEISDVSRRRR